MSSLPHTVCAESNDDERGRVHFTAGQDYFEAGDFDRAAAQFQEAYELSGRPEMLLNLSVARERAGDAKGALEAIELLLERHPRTTYREEALARREQLSATVEPGAHAPTTKPATAPSRAPLAGSGEANPGSHDYWPSATVIGLGSGALAAGVIALGTGVRAHQLYGDLDARCPAGLCSDDGFEDDRDRGQRLSRTSTAFIITAAASAATSVTLWVVQTKRKPGKDRGALTVSGSPSSAHLRFRMAF